MMHIRRLLLVLSCLIPLGVFAQMDTLQTRVYFDFGQSALRADARASLDALLARRTQTTWIMVDLTGRTDQVGDAAANERLSMRRMESVRAYLMQKAALAPEKFSLLNRGENDPLADNTTPQGKSINRSVNVVFQMARPRPANEKLPTPVPPRPVPVAVVPAVQPYDSGCKLDTTIVLPQGTRLVFNRCEYLRLKPCLSFEEALSARSAMAMGLTTQDTLGRTLESCGMIRITLAKGCTPDTCFLHPVLVKTPVPAPDCNSCASPPTLYEITQILRWRSATRESPKITIVKDKGKEYYQYEMRCPSGWKNCDCLAYTKRVKYKAPRGYKISSATLSFECPMIVLQAKPHPEKRPNVVRLYPPCPGVAPYYSVKMISPAGDLITVESQPLAKLKGRRPVRTCNSGKLKRIGRVLWVFPVFQHRLYHKYRLVARKDRIRR
jgi:hypothetical protein